MITIYPMTDDNAIGMDLLTRAIVYISHTDEFWSKDWETYRARSEAISVLDNARWTCIEELEAQFKERN